MPLGNPIEEAGGGRAILRRAGLVFGGFIVFGVIVIALGNKTAPTAQTATSVEQAPVANSSRDQALKAPSADSYPSVSLLTLKADTSIKKFQVSAYFTATTTTLGSLWQSRDNDMTPLTADFEDLPVDIRKRLINSCQLMSPCRVALKGRRTGLFGTITIDEIRFGS